VQFGAQNNLVLRGTISNFINPDSIKQIFNINAKIYTKVGVLKIQDSSLYLKSFKAATLQVELASSSRILGDTGQLLKVSVTPATVLTAEGFIILNVPEYYEGAGQDSMIDSSNPQPCKSQQAVISSCKFSSRLGILTIQYNFRDGNPRSETTDFEIGTFKNPIVSDMGGFGMEQLDAEEYLIA